MTKLIADRSFGKQERGGPAYGPSSLCLFLFMMSASAFTLFGAAKNQIVEKLIPVVEEYSFEAKKDQNYLFNSPSQIDVAGEAVYVLDTLNNRIQIFDRKGNYLMTIGRKGQGPLEFYNPESFFIDEKSKRIFVCDTRNLRIQTCGLDGAPASILKLTFAPSRIVVNEEGLSIMAFASASFIQKKEPLIKKITSDGARIGHFYEPTETTDLLLNLLANTLAMKSDRRGNVVCAHQYVLNDIQVFDPEEKMVSRFSVIYKGEAVAKTGFGYSVRSDEDIQKIAFIVADLAFDSKNNYYFLSGTNGRLPDGHLDKGREIYKYDSRGRYAGTIVLPVSGLLLAFDSQDNLYLIDRNYILRKYKMSGGKDDGP